MEQAYIVVILSQAGSVVQIRETFQLNSQNAVRFSNQISLKHFILLTRFFLVFQRKGRALSTGASTFRLRFQQLTSLIHSICKITKCFFQVIN